MITTGHDCGLAEWIKYGTERGGTNDLLEKSFPAESLLSHCHFQFFSFEMSYFFKRKITVDIRKDTVGQDRGVIHDRLGHLTVLAGSNSRSILKI